MKGKDCVRHKKLIKNPEESPLGFETRTGCQWSNEWTIHIEGVNVSKCNGKWAGILFTVTDRFTKNHRIGLLTD